MDINLFDYNLPDELIAQYPTPNRDESKLLILNRTTDETNIRSFQSIIEYLTPGDALVVNNTRVFKARLIGNRISGGKVEVFLVRKSGNKELLWKALARPSRRLKEGEKVYFDKTSLDNRNYLVLQKKMTGDKWLVEFNSIQSREDIIDNYGHVPLPHYIRRPDSTDDINRYQTIFARTDKTGAVAAPTAGIHFTELIIDQLKEKGVNIVELTLHVGPGTFQPVIVDNIDNHNIDPEYAALSPDAANILNNVRNAGGKVFAVGTTSVRTLESAQIDNNNIASFCHEVDLYIKPGFKFKIVDHLITNFHLPKSSLLILVSAFSGREKILKAYRTAIENNFRFYSYGDAMLIL
ncbi:MAG: tRNA preQ1(34) S-adenosylmethionine ribosyltransferase-isomerase QueA [Candidatus Zixiibacteriota bacterium]